MVSAGKVQVIAQYGVTGVISFGLGIACLAIYGLYGQEPCRTKLPVYVLVSGITLIVGYLVALIGIGEALKNSDLPYSERASKRPETTAGKASSTLTALIQLFNFCWFITGNVWTFTITNKVCQYTLYTFCFWVIIVQWILIALICCIVCSLCIFLCASGKASKS